MINSFVETHSADVYFYSFDLLRASQNALREQKSDHKEISKLIA